MLGSLLVYTKAIYFCMSTFIKKFLLIFLGVTKALLQFFHKILTYYKYTLNYSGEIIWFPGFVLKYSKKS